MYMYIGPNATIQVCNYQTVSVAGYSNMWISADISYKKAMVITILLHAMSNLGVVFVLIKLVVLFFVKIFLCKVIFCSANVSHICFLMVYVTIWEILKIVSGNSHNM